MTIAIDLYDKSKLRAVEIHDVHINGLLAHKLEATQLPGAEHLIPYP